MAKSRTRKKSHPQLCLSENTRGHGQAKPERLYFDLSWLKENKAIVSSLNCHKVTALQSHLLLPLKVLASSALLPPHLNPFGSSTSHRPLSTNLLTKELCSLTRPMELNPCFFFRIIEKSGFYQSPSTEKVYNTHETLLMKRWWSLLPVVQLTLH